MPIDPQFCPRCGVRLLTDETPLECCPNCNADLNWPAERFGLRRMFWIIFLGTPLIAFGMAIAQRLIMPRIPSTLPLIRIAPDLIVLLVATMGALGAGYFLAKTQSYGAGLFPLCPFHAGWILLAYAIVGAIGWFIVGMIH